MGINARLCRALILTRTRRCQQNSFSICLWQTGSGAVQLCATAYLLWMWVRFRGIQRCEMPLKHSHSICVCHNFFMLKFDLHICGLTDARDNHKHFISSFKLCRRCCTCVSVPRALMWNPLVRICTTDWWNLILPEPSRLQLKVSVPEG